LTLGISAPLLDMHVDWMRDGLLPPGSAMLDLGAQQLFCADNPASIAAFIRHCNGPEPSGRELEKLADGGLAGDLFERCGFTYRSIDLTRDRYVLRMDLNHDHLPDDHAGRYRWVTNHGTSEHILNQWNVFKTMHDACAVGGVMYHNVPMSDPTHGIISYSPKFFTELARANGYRLERTWAWSSADQTDFKERFEPEIPFNAQAPGALMWLNVILRRTNDREFRGLVDMPAFHLIPFSATIKKRAAKLKLKRRLRALISPARSSKRPFS
jgi:hypothetical protein